MGKGTCDRARILTGYKCVFRNGEAGVAAGELDEVKTKGFFLGSHQGKGCRARPTPVTCQ